MKIKPIRNNRDYREALKEIDRLMDARGRTPRKAIVWMCL